MADKLDPYHKWLGIAPEEQPPNHYRLLGIKPFEDDADVIQSSAARQTAYVRTFRSGESKPIADRVLREITQAADTLLDPQAKAAYDLELRRKLQATISHQVSSFTVRPWSDWPAGKSPESVDDLQKCLASVGLMTLEESRTWLGKLDAEAQPADAKSFATLLVRGGKLTRYQAAGLLQGKLRQLAYGEYVVLDRIGQGGMGLVLKASHRRMKRTVALKVISSAAMQNADAVRRFQREVEAAARLIHPNIVTAFDANEAGGTHFLVMEFVDGKDLATLVNEHGRLPVVQAIDYTLQAARGLAYAHDNGLIHRDIKPSNLLVDRRGTVKVLDMGLARLDAVDAPVTELTESGQVMGTVDYMAPEQAIDTRSADERADIYSLACTLYKLITGGAMYEGHSLIQKVLAHREHPIPSLQESRPEVPDSLEAAFRRMVAKRVEDRFASMDEVVAELEPIHQQLLQSNSRSNTVSLNDFRLSEMLGGKSPSGSTAVPDATVALAQTAARTGTEETLSRVFPSEATSGNLGEVVAFQQTINPAARTKQRKSSPSLPVLLGAFGGALLLVLVAVAGGLYFLSLESSKQPAKPAREGGKLASAPTSDQEERVTTPEPSGGTNALLSATPAPVAPMPSEAARNLALKFDGFGYAEVPGLVYDATYPITVEVWTKLEPTNQDRPVLRLGGGKYRLKLQQGVANQNHMQPSLLVKQADDTAIHWSGYLNEPVLDQWIHTAIVARPTGEAIAFQDGRQVKLTPGLPRPVRREENSLLIGTPKATVEAPSSFVGLIDELRISRTARYRPAEDSSQPAFTPEITFTNDSDTMALYHFDEGSGEVLVDSTGNNLHGKIVGGTWVDASSREPIPSTNRR